MRRRAGSRRRSKRAPSATSITPANICVFTLASAASAADVPVHTTWPFSITTWRSAILVERIEMLVDQQDRLTFALEPREAGPDLGADQRRQAFGRLIENEQLRIGHQRAADREHLLLAAGELVAHVGAPLGKAREEFVDARQGPLGCAAARRRRRDQILLDDQRRKHLPALRHQPESALRDAIGRAAEQRLAVETSRCRRAPAAGPSACGWSWSCPCRCGRAGSRPRRRRPQSSRRTAPARGRSRRRDLSTASIIPSPRRDRR